jgi:aspartate aminotransferase-like enzyme
VILAPINAQFITSRAAQAAGLGSDAVRYYDLNENFEVDLRSLETVIKTCSAKKESIIMNVIIGCGDTMTGKAQNVDAIIRTTKKAMGTAEKPLTVVDAAPHFFNAWAQNNLNLKNPAIDVVIANPQKCGAALGATLVLFRDLRMLGIFHEAYREHKKITASQFKKIRLDILTRGSWLITKDVSSAIGFFEGLERNGLARFRKERLGAVRNAALFKKLLTTRSDLFTMLSCENTVVSFYVNGNAKSTKAVASKINLSGKAFISYDSDLRAKNEAEISAAESEFNKKGYSSLDGLWATFYWFHTKKDVEFLFKQLVAAASGK